MTFTSELKQQARAAGFDLIGVCPAVTPSGLHRFYEWLELGYGGTMTYLSGRADAYAHPHHVLPHARSLLMLGMNYGAPDPIRSQPRTVTAAATSATAAETAATAAGAPGTGRVASYAWGTVDYHDHIHARLKPLVQFIQETHPGSRARGVVDSAPLLEREFAQLAGLGWIGKHTLLINPQQGSWFFLAAVLTDLTLEYDASFAAEHCGTCTACLDACPTEAFPAPYVLDARRCISYLTIELRESIPAALRPDVGDWLFGCDICQSVCPWNRKAPETTQPEFRPQEDLARTDLANLFTLTDDQFRTLYRRTPLWRVKRRGLLRNAAIVLGNQRPSDSIPALILGLNDAEPLVRAACAWALHQFREPTAERALAVRRSCETDAAVLVELDVCESLP